MKKVFARAIAVLLVFIAGHPVLAADLESGFDAANKLYEQGKFPEAASAYEGLIQTNAISPALYFNLGNARFKAGEFGKAIAAFRRAEQLAPRDPDLRANLQFVRSQIQGLNAPPDRWEQWLGKLTLNEWAILASVPFWIFLLLLAATQLRPHLKSSLRGLIWLSGIATLILGALLAAAWTMKSTPMAIVAVRDAVVRNGPLEESQSAFTVHDGAELKLLDQKNDWIQIGVGDRVGWLKREQVVTD